VTGSAVRGVDLTLCYGERAAVHHLDFEWPAGTLTAIVGPNGAGKSTLLNALAGLLAPRTGRLEVDAELARSVAYLPQQSALSADVPVTVEDLVALGAWSRTGPFGAVGTHESAAVREALRRVGLHGFERRLLATLSAGQRQRALFARVLLEDARLILLDEPFNAVDARTTADLLQVLKDWHAERRTVVAVLHDLELVRESFPDALLLARGGVAAGPPAEVLTAGNLRRARALAEAWVDDAAWCLREGR
jgi:zinc/manganese transport system ATP-binding protein